MNKLFVGILTLGLIGCGQDAVFDINEPGAIPVTCKVLPDATLQCSDGTVRDLNGKDGATGATGQQGATGATGAQGAKGDKGDAGHNGLNGAQGIQGIQGIQGATGARGAQGIQGLTGATGEAGKQGIAGVAGSNGQDGKDGQDGADGTNGVDGKDGADAVILSTTQMPVAGVCHMIAPGVWAKNEGMKADIYNNDECSHQGAVGEYNDNGTICNNLSAFNEHREDHNGEICWVGEKVQVTIEGIFAEMVIKVLTFN